MTQEIKIKLKNYDYLEIYKRTESKYWWVRFYVNAKSYTKNGLHRQSLKLTNQREAEKKAKEIYKNFDFSITKKKNSEISLKKDIFEPFMKHKERRQKFKENGYTTEREEQQFKTWIEPYQIGIDYRDIQSVEENTDEMILEMKGTGVIKDVTIVKYISLLSQMFRFAKEKGIISKTPTFPVLKRIIGNQRLAYERKEQKLIFERCKQEYLKTEDKFFDEMCDYLRWISIDGWRQGLEPLNIRHFQVRLVKFQNYKQSIMRINVIHTKTGKQNWLEAFPQFVDENWSRITSRYPNFTAEDYVFYPEYKSEEDRMRIWERIRKNFVRFSRELNLYIKDGKTRPMTAYRHTSAQTLKLQGVSDSEVASRLNTSEEMIRKVYTHSSNEPYAVQRHIERYKEYYTREDKKKA